MPHKNKIAKDTQNNWNHFRKLMKFYVTKLKLWKKSRKNIVLQGPWVKVHNLLLRGIPQSEATELEESTEHLIRSFVNIEFMPRVGRHFLVRITLKTFLLLRPA